MRAATDMDDHRAIHSKQRFGSIQQFRLSDGRNAFSNFVFRVACDLIELFAIFGRLMIVFIGSFLFG
jgi:hypothetical protein